MKCYYDVLGLDKNVPQESIKKAYYKLSLKWHPDKNQDNIAEATEVFKDIQRAYKVLSDVHERSWYDKNRERFMTMSFNSEDELYDLIHTSVYSGFGNDDSGFYNVYSYVFEVLGEREKEACRISGIHLKKIPPFGNSDSDYHDYVSLFYEFWDGFKTKMSFHWKNKHDIDLSIPRDIRRIMEKENADERNSARKMYNKEVQNFVENIKLKDPRIKMWKEHLKDKAKENEKKAINMKHKAWERSRKPVETSQPSKVYGEISVDELEETLKLLELEHGKLGGEDQDKDTEDFYCIACNKYFKSLPAFSNHEKSRNHAKNLATLRSQMILEDDQLFTESVDEEAKIEEHNDATLETHGPKVKDVINSLKEIISYSKDEQSSESDETEFNVKDVINSLKEIISETKDESREIEYRTNDVDDDDISSNKKIDKKRRRRPKTERVATKVENSKSTEVESDLVCEQCKTYFSTRNKLFQHIQSTGHATIKGMASKSKLKSKK